MTAAENRTEDRMFHLFSDQLHSITEHLALLKKTPFDQAQYLLQTEALIRDILSAQTSFTELQRWQVFKELILVHGTTLENLSQEIDYQLTVLQSRISGLAKHVPDDKDIYRLQLRKLSEEGEKLKDLSKQLIRLFSKYYLSPHDGPKGEAR
ncbi:nuclear transport factor 2 family protein [Acidobacteria bacterium AH-259-D05]|nr:nuclear transport factor 2 family protein [Acidobacteria bacterium AH-259-D05]